MVPVITALSADLVSHRQWPLKQWFRAPGIRYYHRPKPPGRVRPGPRFYQQIDPQLRPLCRLLHAHGIATTASCEGHDHDKDYFEQRWEELCTEAALIRESGLPVFEAESDAPYRFHDPEYRLPWSGFPEFLGDSLIHQSTGYIGIIIPAHHIRLARFQPPPSHDNVTLSPDAELGRYFGGHFYHLSVKSTDGELRARRWRAITDWFRRVLRDG